MRFVAQELFHIQFIIVFNNKNIVYLYDLIISYQNLILFFIPGCHLNLLDEFSIN
jgi:hypothetical protein